MVDGERMPQGGSKGTGPSSRWRATDSRDLQSTDLVAEDGAWLQGLSGVPATADSCAYEPIQKLLAVGPAVLLPEPMARTHKPARLGFVSCGGSWLMSACRRTLAADPSLQASSAPC